MEMEDPIFLAFVVILIILFLLLLLRRLYYSRRSPTELQFSNWEPPQGNGHQGGVPTVSVRVHRNDQQQPRSTPNVLPTAPPSFESVVSQSKTDVSVSNQAPENFVDEVPPPSYEEYLRFQQEHSVAQRF